MSSLTQHLEQEFFGEQVDLGRPVLPDDVAEALDRESVPSAQAVVVKALRVIESDGSCAADLERVLCLDAAMSARLLRIANSPLYGHRGRISTIRHAIAMIGFRATRSLVLSTAMINTFPKDDAVASELWRHAASVATLARLVAHRRRHLDPETAFVGGLIHDVGKLALLRAFKEHYAVVIEEARLVDMTALQLEWDYFGTDHAAVGGHLVHDWGFGEGLRAIVRCHHSLHALFSDRLPVATRALVATIRLADDLVHANEGRLESGEPPINVVGGAQEIIALDDAELNAIWEEWLWLSREVELIIA